SEWILYFLLTVLSLLIDVVSGCSYTTYTGYSLLGRKRCLRSRAFLVSRTSPRVYREHEEDCCSSQGKLVSVVFFPVETKRTSQLFVSFPHFVPVFDSQGLSKTIRVMFLTPPPVNEEMIVEYFRGNHLGRTNAAMRKYADACLNVCTEMEVTPVDIWPAFQLRADFTDGIHPSSEGSRKIADEIFKVLKQTDGEPSLYWQTMPIEFPGLTDYDAHGYQDYLKLTSRL
ncbi:GDSL esterase/lipase At2g38180, partial [Linum perenne]